MKRKLITSVLALSMLISGMSGAVCADEAGADVGAAIAEAEEYLEAKAYYTGMTVSALETALSDLKEFSGLGDPELISIALNDVETAIEGLEPAYTRYTLSGNTWSESDQTMFYDVWEPGFDLITLDENMPSYSYAREDSIENQTAPNADPGLTKLTGGNIIYGDNVWTKWQQEHPIEVDFDLGGIYAVDRVDLIQDIQSAGNAIGKLEVYISEDGNYYTKVAETEGNNDNKLQGAAGHEHTLTSVKMPVKKTRYVRVSAERGSYQLRVSQIAIFGYKSILGGIENMSAEGQKYIEAAEYYTPASIENLQSALDAAALVTEDSPQSEIEEAAAAIENAISALEIVNQRLVLSGNTWSESDIALYAELTPPISLVNGPNNPSYTWAEGSSSDCISQDPELVKMNGGGIENFAGTQSVGTKWEDEAPGITVWNLGVTGVIDRVDVFSMHEQYKQLGSVTVSVSADGKTFTDVKTQQAAGEYIGSGQALYQTVVTFAPVEARFVKVTCRIAARTADADVRMTNINEIVIFGIGSDYSDMEADFTQLENELAKYGADAMSTLEQFATEESYNAFAAAVAAGRAMTEAGSGTQFEADAALEEIKAKFEAIVYKEAEGVLTNNLTGDFDKSLYPGLDNINTGMSYSLISDDTNSSIISQDVSLTNLTRGNISATPGSESNFGRWDGDLNVSIILDAAEEVYFTGADLYEWARTDGLCGVGGIKISVSSDGDKYTEITSVDSDYAAGDEGLFLNGNMALNKLGAAFVPVRGRYIKIDSACRGHQQVLAEVVITGFRVPQVSGVPLSFGQTDYIIMDTEGGDLTQIAGADFILVSGELINESETPAAVKVISAVYDGGHRLVKLAVGSDVTIEAGRSGSWENLLEGLGGLPQGSYLVNFAWTADGSMIPMANTLIKQ